LRETPGRGEYYRCTYSSDSGKRYKRLSDEEKKRVVTQLVRYLRIVEALETPPLTDKVQ
jgi:hypothetical protein